MKITNITNNIDGSALLEFEEMTDREKKLLYSVGHKEAVKEFKRLIKTSNTEFLKIPTENEIIALGFNKVLKDYIDQQRDGAIGSLPVS